VREHAGCLKRLFFGDCNGGALCVSELVAADKGAASERQKMFNG
jgi:hypothetical protein